MRDPVTNLSMPLGVHFACLIDLFYVMFFTAKLAYFYCKDSFVLFARTRACWSSLNALTVDISTIRDHQDFQPGMFDPTPQTASAVMQVAVAEEGFVQIRLCGHVRMLLWP